MTSVGLNANPADTADAVGLSSDEARKRLVEAGANEMPDTTNHPITNAMKKLWAPVPWMLEAAIVLELVLHKRVEAVIIATLLLLGLREIEWVKNAHFSVKAWATCRSVPSNGGIPHPAIHMRDAG